MKKFRLLVLCLIITVMLTALASCGKGEGLDAPKGAFIEYETLTFRWSEVDGAKIYTVCIEREGDKAKEIDVSRPYYSLEGLEPGKYTVSVSASRNKRGEKPSPYTDAIEFIREAESGLVFKLIDGAEYEVSDKGSATGVIEIPETYRQKPVTSIGGGAFFAKNDVTEIILPSSIKSIGESAFASCTYLEKINLPEGLTSLGKDAFSGCRALGESINIPNSLTEIPDGAFASCSSISEVSFGTGLVSIGKNAFTDCSNITSLSFPASLREIGSFAFAACARVSTVTICEGVEIIGDFAFSKAMALSEITLPESTRVIGNGAFYHCTSLASVAVGASLDTIGHSAFIETPIYESSETNEVYVGNWFIGLKDESVFSLDIKYGTVGIANNALYANQNIQSVELPDSVRRIGSLAFGGSKIVSIVTGGGLEYIGDQAFNSCYQLVTVLLGSYDYTLGQMSEAPLEYIGNYAFMNCALLETIRIPESVRDIGSYAFRGTGIYNAALTGVVYADNWLVDFNENIIETVSVRPGTKGIARYAFYNCRTLKSVTIPGSVEIICRGAFYGCCELENITLPDTLSKIEDYTFYSCSKLKIKSLPPMLCEIGRSAFYAVGTVKDYNTDTDSDTLEIPSGVTHIGDFAFFGCGFRQADSMSGVTETGGIDIIIMGDMLEYVGRCAFYGFKSVREVRIGGALAVGDMAFYSCPSLEKITVGSALAKIGDMAFYECSSLKSVTLPDSLSEVGAYAFYRCDALSDITLGARLVKIGDFAFYGDKSITTLYLPATVTHIGNQAFRGCSALTSLTLSASVEFIGEHAFYSCDKLTLYFESTAPLAEWDRLWNSTFCPEVWGCELSADGDFVISMTVGNVKNAFFDTTLSSPERDGYTFLGFSTDIDADEAEYSFEDALSLAVGTKIYPVFCEINS